MTVSAYQSIWISHLLSVLINIAPNGLREILQIHLMTDTRPWRHYTEIIECTLTPLEEGVALHVPFVFSINVHLESLRVSKFINHYRMVNHQINGV